MTSDFVKGTTALWLAVLNSVMKIQP